MYPISVIDNQIKSFLEMQNTTISNENTINNNKKVYFKLPYIKLKLSLKKFAISTVKTLTLQ